jgi:hypothetical protein
MPSRISSAYSLIRSSRFFMLVALLGSMYHESTGILLPITQSRQTNPHTLRVQKPEVMHSTVNHGATLVHRRQGLVLRGIKHDCHIVPLGKHLLHHVIVALTAAERQMIVCRQIPTIRMLGVIVKLHLGKHRHDVRVIVSQRLGGTDRRRDTDGLPPKIARQIQTKRRCKVHTICTTDSRTNIPNHIKQKGIPCLKETLGLRNARLLRPGKSPVAAGIETGRRTPFGRRGTYLIPADGVRGKVQPERQIAQILALLQLRIALSEQHAVFLSVLVILNNNSISAESKGASLLCYITVTIPPS